MCVALIKLIITARSQLALLLLLLLVVVHVTAMPWPLELAATAAAAAATTCWWWWAPAAVGVNARVGRALAVSGLLLLLREGHSRYPVLPRSLLEELPCKTAAGEKATKKRPVLWRYH